MQPVPSSGERDLFVNRRGLRLILSLLLSLATLSLYNPLSRAPFLSFDDNAYVYENYQVRAGLTWSSVRWAFTTNAESNWHPLTWLSHMLDMELFGLRPSGPHYVNVLLHVVNVVLLFLLLEQATQMLWRSLAVASLFAVHPLNVEAVAWISERKCVLSMLFFLLAIMAYERYARRPSVPRYLLVAVCFALGLMAKPQVITLPFVLLLLDYWPLGRVPSPPAGQRWSAACTRLILEKLPLLALSAASAVITMKVQVAATNLKLPFAARIANAALSYAKYLEKIFWPVGLAPMYPHPGLSVNSFHAVLAACLLAIVTVVVVLSGRRYAIVGWFWFLGTLVPMIGLVQVGLQAMADRYVYIPLIGLLIVICWGAAELFEAMQAKKFYAPLAAGFAFVALCLACHTQIGYWANNLTLWTHTLDVTQNNFIAEDSVALALLEQGRMDEAVSHFQEASRINPQDPIALLNLGTYEQQRRQNYPAAIAYYDAVLRLTRTPRLLAMVLTNRGYAFYSEKQDEQARRSFEVALTQMPDSPQALLGLGLIAQVSGDFARATENYREAVQFMPSDVGYLLLAQSLDKAGRKDEADQSRAQAERISRDIDAAKRAADGLLRQ